MAITSMTGFARREGVADTWKWVWEARSVNGKGLDVRYRLPSAFDTPDSDLKRKAQALKSSSSFLKMRGPFRSVASIAVSVDFPAVFLVPCLGVSGLREQFFICFCL